MTGIYLCQYLSNEGKVCGRPCYRQEGCAIHWKRRQRVPCLECAEEAREDGAKIRSAWKKYIASEYTDIVQSNVSSCHKLSQVVTKFSIDMAIDLFDGEEVYDEEYEVIDCQIHRNFSTYESCKKCGKLTISKFGACIMHVEFSIDMAIDLFDGEEVYDEEYEVIDCQIHRNFSTYESCKKCGKLTISKFGACIMHVGKYRSRDHYQRKKLEKMAEKLETFGKNT
ncbi:hypothetical protein Glove_688g10 [Diversispora epigaea]|uniref:Uncharacterized protein n=1 Tax=Diversispora epigaea TaxID=1348612 RepID=A0A397G550_9GLOM|nr:hypothetical protein Glove_688g10 [Diversispora epigaea]